MQLNVVDVQLVVFLIIIVVFSELEVDLLVVICTKGVGLVDLGGLRQLPNVLQGSGLVRVVLMHHITLVILEISQRHQDDVTLTHPHLLSQFSSNVAHSLDTIKTGNLKSTISQHLGNLGVFLALILVDQLSFLTTVHVLSLSSVFASFSFRRFTHFV